MEIFDQIGPLPEGFGPDGPLPHGSRARAGSGTRDGTGGRTRDRTSADAARTAPAGAQ